MVSEEFKVGDRVEWIGPWVPGVAPPWTGTITHINEDGTYGIKWDGGHDQGAEDYDSGYHACDLERI